MMMQISIIRIVRMVIVVVLVMVRFIHLLIRMNLMVQFKAQHSHTRSTLPLAHSLEICARRFRPYLTWGEWLIRFLLLSLGAENKRTTVA